MRGECAFLDMYLWLCQLSFILNPYLFTPYHTFQLLPRSSEPYTHDEFCFQMIRTRTCACEDLNLGDWVVHSNNQVSLIFFVRYEVHLLNGSVINWYVYLLLWKLIGLGLSMAYEVQVATRCSDCSFMMALKLQGQKERRCGDHLGGILPFVWLAALDTAMLPRWCDALWQLLLIMHGSELSLSKREMILCVLLSSGFPSTCPTSLLPALIGMFRRCWILSIRLCVTF
jgi:hypothetical protein